MRAARKAPIKRDHHRTVGHDDNSRRPSDSRTPRTVTRGVPYTESPTVRGAEARGNTAPPPFAMVVENAELAHQIQFTEQELADIVALARDAAEQQRFSESDIPDEIKSLMEEGMDLPAAPRPCARSSGGSRAHEARTRLRRR